MWPRLGGVSGRRYKLGSRRRGSCPKSFTSSPKTGSLSRISCRWRRRAGLFAGRRRDARARGRRAARGGRSFRDCDREPAPQKRDRHLSNWSVLDLRVFAYADLTLPRDSRFFLCGLARSIGSRVPFKTSATDMVRDYAGRTEVAAMIRCWEAAGARNTPLDVYTRAPARKLDILRLAHERYGIEMTGSLSASLLADGAGGAGLRLAGRGRDARARRRRGGSRRKGFP